MSNEYNQLIDKVGNWLPAKISKSDVQKFIHFRTKFRTYSTIASKKLNKIISKIKKHISLYTIINILTINVQWNLNFSRQNHKIRLKLMEHNKITKSQYSRLKERYLTKNRNMHSLYLELNEETPVDKELFFRLINRIRIEEGLSEYYTPKKRKKKRSSIKNPDKSANPYAS